MLTFFRKFRKALLSKGVVSKYLLYAIGEIALVVIGILIALQVNNLNTNRQNIEKERLILSGIKDVFHDNLAILSGTEYDRLKRAHQATLDLLDMANPNPSNFAGHAIDSLLSLVLSIPSFYPSTGVIDELLNSGQLSLIRDIELRNHLSNWPGLLHDYTEDITIGFNYQQNVVLPVLGNYINWKNTDQFLRRTDFENMGLGKLSRSQFKSSYKIFLASKEVENVLYLNSANLAYSMKEYKNIQRYFEETIEMINASLTQ